MSELPVHQIIPQLLTELKQRQYLLLSAPPGAGKSTAVPLAILQQAQFPGLIVMLEPRRLAARHIAGFLASQLGESVGQQVGYQMRGEVKRSEQTRLLVVTEGILTRMLQDDPLLESVSLVIFDEFHERSLPADLGLTLALDACAANEELRLLVMSATLDMEAVATILPNAALLRSEGRSFPIELDYQPLPARGIPLDQHCARVIEQVAQEQSGNILVFLPGVAEINRVASVLNQSQRLAPEIKVHTLYGAKSLDEQRRAIEPPPKGQRKVVLATNIAETSLTIEGIRVVIDSGLERIASYHHASGVTRLMTRMICQSSAEQRAGRAGRLEPGYCVRLYSQEQLDHRPKFSDPQIMHSDLMDLLLQLKQWGAGVDELTWVDRPPTGALRSAERLLQQLGLTDEKGQLTAAATLTSIGCGARSAALLDQAQRLAVTRGTGLLERAVYLAALLEQRLPRASSALLEDALKQQDKTQARQLRQQVQRYARQFNLATINDAPFTADDGVLLSAALVDRIAQQRGDGENYRLANGFALHGNGRHEPWLVVLDLGWPQQRASGQLYLATPVNLAELQAAFPRWFGWHNHCDYDDSRQGFMSEQQQRLGELVIARKPEPKPDPAALEQGWLAAIRKQGIAWLQMNECCQQFRARVNSLRQWLPELELPDLTDEGLLESLDKWLPPYLTGVTTLKKLRALDWLEILRSQIAWQSLKQLDELAPTHYQAPSGRRVAIHYQSGQSPRISLKLQEMFGEPQSPKVAQHIPLTIELLSPAGRPLQLTQDLASFWQNAYPEVRKEMRGRYPKHPWPEDPATSEATRKTNRQLRK